MPDRRTTVPGGRAAPALDRIGRFARRSAAEVLTVAAWRRRALELFPDLRRDLTGADYNVYSLFFDLKPRLRKAFDRDDTDRVRRVFGFAEWCAAQTAQELCNAAGVAFYEHLFDYPAYSERVVPWLSAAVVYDHWKLWEAMVEPSEWARVAPWLESKRATGAREADQRR